MTALILFARALGEELTRIADMADGEMKALDGTKDASEQVTLIAALAAAQALRWAALAVERAAKRAFHL